MNTTFFFNSIQKEATVSGILMKFKNGLWRVVPFSMKNAYCLGELRHCEIKKRRTE